IFGESHGNAIGGVIDNLPPGIELDMEFIESELRRRKPGEDSFSTKRKEDDQVEILSGYFNGYTTGTPLAFMIRNKDTHSKDYTKLKSLMRPGHADLTGHIKYHGYNDYRGGGHFSGRITAPLVFFGAVAKQYLKENYNIKIISRIKRIENVLDDELDLMMDNQEEIVEKLSGKKIPVMNPQAGEKMLQAIIDAKNEVDSVGGIIQCICLNVPAGCGMPFFESLESKIAHLIFSVPATKGIQFGRGFEISSLRGSEANDSFKYDADGKLRGRSNNNGGILGGITDGLPVIFDVAMKPTPSISKEQDTIDIDNKENARLVITGRHDPCIVPRALPVIESCGAIALMELLTV
ncbi:MAG: chorismate synthase, partial [Eubacteriaceae bacterium]|nr:chorismate synthase [Eubacteriaceae bacterium]